MTAALQSLAEEALLYTWPLYEMRRMRAATSPRRKSAPAGEMAPNGQRWCNLFIHTRKLLRAGGSKVVTPNNDTLYTNAWLDLTRGPLVIDVPETAGRYYVLGLLDFYTNPFAHIGQRLTGTRPRAFLVTPPRWPGEIPAAFQAPGAHIAAPTPWLWVIGRILVDGEDDLPAVHALQERFAIHTLAGWLAPSAGQSAARTFDPGCDPQTPVSAAHYATQVNAALRDNPPPAQEAALVARFAAVGLGAGLAAPEATQCAVLQQALDAVLPRLRSAQAARSGSSARGGWAMPRLFEGSFGRDWLARAQTALQYIGMLESREATYPLAWHDSAGRSLTGAQRYRLHFAAGAMPPVDAFWSITLYDAHTCMLVDNPINRYAIGDRTSSLHYHPDGSLTLHIQHAMPPEAAARANWLPAPPGPFYLCLRAYIPRPPLLDGSYTLPAIECL